MGRTQKKPSTVAPGLHGSGKTIPAGKGKTVSGKHPRSMKTIPVREPSSSSEVSSLSEEHPPPPRTPKAPKQRKTTTKDTDRVRKIRSLVNKQNPLPTSNATARKRKAMASVPAATPSLGNYLSSSMVTAYTHITVSQMREQERMKFGKPDPYACVKTSIISIANETARKFLLERGEITEDTALSVTISPLTMALMKRLLTERISNLTMGTTTICEVSGRKRITPQYIMAYNRISRVLDGGVMDLPMSDTTIDLTHANEIANEAEKTMKADAAAARAAKAESKTAKAPRKRLTAEERDAAAKKKADEAAERKRKRDEVAAAKKEAAEARKQQRVEEAAERKQKREQEVAAKKKKREQEAADKKKLREAEAAIAAAEEEEKEEKEEAKPVDTNEEEPAPTSEVAPTDDISAILGTRLTSAPPSPQKRSRVETRVAEEPPAKKVKPSSSQSAVVADSNEVDDIIAKVIGASAGDASFDFNF